MSPGRGCRLVAAITIALAASACAGGSSSPDEDDAAPTAVEIVVEPGSLDAEQQRAFRAVASAGAVGTSAAADGQHHQDHDHAAGAGGHTEHGEHGGPSASAPASPALRAQLAQAEGAARELMTQPRLSRAGYHVGSYYSPGVGTHYIDWRLVGDRFDPARPAMLLVDTTPGHPRQLAGFSYWVRSDGPPEGFAGDGDEWHVHRDMCFVEGVETREGVSDPADCEGEVVAGGELWMLHAWVVPDYENPDGVFAPTNPKLCPPRTGVDAGWC